MTQKLDKHIDKVFVGLTLLFILLYVGYLHADNLQGRKNRGPSEVEAGEVLTAMMNTHYESKEFQIVGAQSDVDVKSVVGMFLSTAVPVAHHISIRTDADITVKFSTDTNHSISIDATESPFEWHNLEITNLLVTTVGTTNLKVVMD